MQIDHHSAPKMAGTHSHKNSSAHQSQGAGRVGGRLVFQASHRPRPAAKGDIRGVQWGDMQEVSKVPGLGLPNVRLVPFTVIPLLAGILDAKAILCKYVLMGES